MMDQSEWACLAISAFAALHSRADCGHLSRRLSSQRYSSRMVSFGSSVAGSAVRPAKATQVRI